LLVLVCCCVFSTAGLNDAASAGFKDIFKCIRAALTDKVIEVRVSGANCGLGMATAGDRWCFSSR
jgi:hypothetical protein